MAVRSRRRRASQKYTEALKFEIKMSFHQHVGQPCDNTGNVGTHEQHHDQRNQKRQDGFVQPVQLDFGHVGDDKQADAEGRGYLADHQV